MKVSHVKVGIIVETLMLVVDPFNPTSLTRDMNADRR